jgi:two-component system, OmpR family, sensor histidine kinase KdpD
MSVLIAGVLVAAVTAVASAFNAGTTTASMLYVMGVLLVSLRGRVAGVIAAVASFVALNYVFTPPVGSFQVAKRQDLDALFAFLVVALVVGNVVARTNELRHKAEQREREARIRLDLTQRLLAGEPAEDILAGACHALVNLFELASCCLEVDAVQAGATRPVEPGDHVHLSSGGLSLTLREGHHRPLSASDLAVLEGLTSGMATALAYHRLEASAAEARLSAEVNRTRSEFLSAVSHNLKTPLATIKTAVSPLLDTKAHLESTDRTELLEIICEESDHLERLVTKVLDLTRVRVGGLQLDLQEVELADLAWTAIRRLRPLTRQHRLRLDMPQDLPPVEADVTLIEQVFLNLLENAVRYAPAGSEIVLTAHRVGANLEVRVVDHGCGVPVAQRELVFEEFYRGDGTHETSGTGLGLAIVRAVISAHGGQVWYEETPGGGATFALRLPSGRWNQHD